MHTPPESSPDDPNNATPWRGQWLVGVTVVIAVGFTWLPQSYYRMMAWPWVALWQVGFGLIVIWLAGILRQHHQPFYRLGDGLDWVVGGFVITIGLATLLAPFPAVALNKVGLILGYGIALYGLRNGLHREKGDVTANWEHWWAGLCSVGIVTSLLSLGQVFVSVAQDHSVRNGWPLGHPNFMAGYLLLMLPLTLALAVARGGWQRGFLLAASGMMLVDLYYTDSRGGFLGLLVTVIVSLGVWLIQTPKQQRYRYGFVGAIALVTLLGFLVNNPRVRQLIKIHPPGGQLPLITFQLDGESLERLLAIQAAGNILRDRPWFGVGPGNLSRVYNLYRPVESGTGFDHLQQLHNTPVHIFGELGLVGLAGYVGLLLSLGLLWLRLYRHLQIPAQRYLLYGLGASGLAYQISSLTDYQLENIGISATLVVEIGLLLHLAHISELSPPHMISPRYRRIGSLGAIALLGVLIVTWSPMTLAMYFGAQGKQQQEMGNVAVAYDQFARAAKILPWDPTYHQLAAQEILSAQRFLDQSTTGQELQQIAEHHLQDALMSAPNDAWWNHDLGVFYRQRAPEVAERYFSRAVQLLPRNPSYYDYFLLGQAYLAQGKSEQAIAAFALQGLIQPECLTWPIWSQSPWRDLHPTVVQQTLGLLDDLLRQVPKTNPVNQQVYATGLLLRWWFKLPLPTVEPPRLRTITAAILVAEFAPQSAITLLNQTLEANPATQTPGPLLLLRAQLQPDTYLSAYQTYLQHTQQIATQQTVIPQKPLRQWLKTQLATRGPLFRSAGTLVYRNQNMTLASKVLTIDEIPFYWIPRQLDLFPVWPRHFPALDQVIATYKAEQLSLPHPTTHQFQLTPKLPPDG